MRTILCVVALAVTFGSIGTPTASGQAIDAAWAQQFVGSWDVVLETPDGAVPTVVTVKEEAGKTTVQLGRGDQAGRAITKVRRSGDSLVAEYEIQYSGMDLPATITLKRNGDGLTTEWVFADGAYQTKHEATKR